jgi:murein DD-endopeptidase MepM/ murein hydrolase activator NlpD
MLTFPLRRRPSANYHTGGRRFGADRDAGRKHAGCDLIAPLDTEILAVDDGFVLRGPYPFFHGTFAVEVQHTMILVRYCEIRAVASGVRVGASVTRGQVIAFVGRMNVDSMLHIEMYSGFDDGPLTVRSNHPFERRLDLMDPTDFLDRAVMVSP